MPLSILTASSYCPIAFAIALLLGVACASESGDVVVDVAAATASAAGDTLSVTAQQFTASGFAVGAFEEVGFRQNVSAVGELALPPEAEMLVSSVSGGIVSGLRLIEGETVRRGQTLFAVTSPELLSLQRELLETRARLVYLHEELARQRALDSANVSARKTLSAAESEVRVADAIVAGLSRQLRAYGIDAQQVSTTRLLDRLSVTAPRSGQIAAVYAHNGQRLAPGETAVEIVATDELHLELYVLERDVPLLREGQAVRFMLPDGAAPRTATVHLIAPTIDSLRRATVHCDLPAVSSRGLLAGMYVQAEVTVGDRSYPSLPEEAIVEQEGSQIVLMLTTHHGTRFVPRTVDVGPSQDGRTAILNAADFPPGATFLTQGAFYLMGVE